jgi:hypothetical protein
MHTKALQASERATPRVQQARATSQPVRPPLAVARGQVVEEAGRQLARPRRCGRASRGERVVEAVPQHDGPPVTRRGALVLPGVDAVMTGEEAPDGDVGRADVEQVRGPPRVPGEVGRMDHLRAPQVGGSPGR